MSRLTASLLAAILLSAACFSWAQDEPVWRRFGIQLTAAEQAWLAANPVVKFSSDPAWPPFSFYNDQGVFDGIDADLLALIHERTGMRFEAMKVSAWSEAEALAHSGQVDMLTSTARSPEREAVFDFTSPYYSASMAIIMRDDAPFWQGLRDLHSRSVAAPRGYVTTAMLARDHPEIRLHHTATSAEALSLVSRGNVDAVIDNVVTASRLMRDEGLGNLKIVGIVEPGFELRIAVAKGRPDLV